MLASTLRALALALCLMLIATMVADAETIDRPDGGCAEDELGVLADSVEVRNSLSEADCSDPFDPSDRADLLRFQLDAPATVNLVMRADPFHAHLRLVGGQGVMIAASHSRAFGASARIERELTPGEYQIVATEFTRGQRTGDYLLRIEAAPREPGDEPPFVYPYSEPSYLEPPDWVHFGRETHTRCSAEPLEILKRDAIAVVLFNHPTLLFDRFLLAPRYIAHSYNCHAAHPDIGWSGYEHGHSGWDLQTHSVIGAKTADHVFYSLTNGVVAYSGGSYGAIVIHTDDGHTVWYQHARRIYVWPGTEVTVGTPLGVQGNVGMGFTDETTAEHVHIAVREGRHGMPPPAGAIETIDPIPYFHRYLFE